MSLTTEQFENGTDGDSCLDELLDTKPKCELEHCCFPECAHTCGYIPRLSDKCDQPDGFSCIFCENEIYGKCTLDL